MRALLPLLLVAGCASAPPLPFDLVPPGDEPELFAPGIVSTDDAIELNGVLSPDGRELFFTRVLDGVFTMHRTRFADGAWTEPEAIHPFTSPEADLAVDMAYSADGNTLVFLGRAPDGATSELGLDLWRIRREGDAWSKAELIPAPVSSADVESYPCLVADRSIYFSSRRDGGLGEADIYRAQMLSDGSYAEPVNIGVPVNSEHSEGDTWVAPDESVLVVASRRPDGFGSGDLWISTKSDEGGWTTPRNLGPTINTELLDYCPMGTWDGRLFFFSRRDGATWDDATSGTVHWVDARVLERLANDG